MATGSNSGSLKTFLSVGFGKLRQKTLENKERVNKDTPNAVKRETQQGGESWAIEFDWITGIIENIFHKDDPQYGDSFEVVLRDATDLYQISFDDSSRFWFDFAKKLPNIDLKSMVKLNPYDFTEKGTNKRRVGLSIEQNGQKITSFYDKQNPDKTWVILNGFPKPPANMDWKDKDETKIFTIKVKKFLKAEFENRIAPKFENASHKITHEEPTIDDETSDLPF